MGAIQSGTKVDQIAAGTRIERVMANIRQRIAARSLVPGARLPSVRALAKTMQVSTSTVVEAYDRLVADGTINSRPGSGFFVSGPLWACTHRPNGIVITCVLANICSPH